MKELIRFELIKARYNNLYIVVLVIVSIILFLSMLFSINTYHKTYIYQQQENAKVKLNMDNNLSVEIRNFYQKISYSNTWQNMYQIYNEIDALNQGLETDLNYDAKTNIEYRNYNLNYLIEPESNTGGNWIIDIYNSYLKYILIGIFIILGFNIVLSEYQEGTNNYLFCLSYSYGKLFLSKLIVNLLVVFVTVILPVVIFYLIYSLSIGFTNPHTIFETGTIFYDVIINDHSFITINNLLLLRLVEMIISCLLINIGIFVSIYLYKIKKFSFSILRGR